MSISIIGGIIFGSFLPILGGYSQTMVIYSFMMYHGGTKGSGFSGVNQFMADKVFFVITWLLALSMNSAIHSLLSLNIFSLIGSYHLAYSSSFSLPNVSWELFHFIFWTFLIFSRCLSILETALFGSLGF